MALLNLGFWDICASGTDGGEALAALNGGLGGGVEPNLSMAGARRGWDSVLNTHSSSEMVLGSSNVKYLSKEKNKIQFRAESEKDGKIINWQVFHNFSKEEAFLIILASRIRDSRIVNIIKSANTAFAARDFQELLEAFDNALGVLQVFDIARYTPGVEVRFHYFGTENVVGFAIIDIEPMFVEKV